MVFQKIFIPSQQDSQCPTLLVLIAEFFASLAGGVWGRRAVDKVVQRVVAARGEDVAQVS